MEQEVQSDRPAFKDLPLRNGDPQHSAWGLWGTGDELGTLNLLTPLTTKRAAGEIQTGHRFSLNWSLGQPVTSGFGRHVHPFEHKIMKNPNLLTLDDSVVFNTQKSSQWDGLRHFGYQKEQLFYNGATLDDIMRQDSGKLGLQKWHEIGGVSGRGLLIDYWSWSVENKKEYDASKAVSVKFDDIMSCLKWQQGLSSDPGSLIPRKGDILFIRVGYPKRYLELSPDEEREIQSKLPPETCGVHQDVRMLEWLWDSGIAAVAGDAPAWECFPPDPKAGFMYHEVLLAGWGCPIAELLWLEELAKNCKQERRWTFFISSAPLNVNGGVASPANMIAIQ